MAAVQLKLESPWAPKSLHVEKELPSEHGSAHLTSQTPPPPKDQQKPSCLEPTLDLKVSLMTHLRQLCTMQQRSCQSHGSVNAASCRHLSSGLKVTQLSSIYPESFWAIKTHSVLQLVSYLVVSFSFIINLPGSKVFCSHYWD